MERTPEHPTANTVEITHSYSRPDGSGWSHLRITVQVGAPDAAIQEAIATWQRMYTPTLHALAEAAAASNGTKTIGPDQDPGDHRVGFGKYKDLTIAQIWHDQHDSSYVRDYLSERAFSAVTRNAAKEYAARMDNEALAEAEADEDRQREEAREELMQAARSRRNAALFDQRDDERDIGASFSATEDIPF